MNINRKELTTALTYLCSAVPESKELDVYSYIKCTPEKLTAANGYTEVSVPFIGFDSTLLLPRKALQALKLSKGGEVEITSADGVTTLKAKNSKYKFSTTDVENFPEWEVQKVEHSFIVNGANLKEVQKVEHSFIVNGANLKTLTKFVSKDDMKVALCSVFVSKVDQVATNAHMLVLFGKAEAKEEGYLLPPSFIATLPDEDVELSFTASHVYSDNARGVLTNETFPNYPHVVPKSEPTVRVAISNEEFQAAIKGALLVANTETCAMKLAVSENGITLSANDIDFSRDANIFVECSTQGVLEIGINGKLTLAMLSILAPTVELNFTAPTQAFLMLGGDAKCVNVPVILH
jgi:DNA polymerase III sliding clamp (beta) subunit (PCNA family)